MMVLAWMDGWLESTIARDGAEDSTGNERHAAQVVTPPVLTLFAVVVATTLATHPAAVCSCQPSQTMRATTWHISFRRRSHRTTAAASHFDPGEGQGQGQGQHTVLRPSDAAPRHLECIVLPKLGTAEPKPQSAPVSRNTKLMPLYTQGL